MANQIAAFFRTYPEDEAVAGIHKHLVSFWAPKMIRDLTAHIPVAGDKLDAYVVKALDGERPAGESPVRPATHDPQLAGLGASDAG
ncbi:formate dehydrogenase subunit delta [Methylobacterium brachythecii]|nr:formate dehydrogenase subunit delta [Methylobacterium brachythecii]